MQNLEKYDILNTWIIFSLDKYENNKTVIW